MVSQRRTLSFSILSLLLTVSLSAVGTALYLSKCETRTLSLSYDRLLETSEQILDLDPTCFNFLELPSPAPLVYQFQIAVPHDKTLELRVSYGDKKRGLQSPTIFKSDVLGPRKGSSTPPQYKITVSIQTTDMGLKIGYNSAAGDSKSMRMNGAKIAWLDEFVATHLPDQPPIGLKSPIQTCVSPVLVDTGGKLIIRLGGTYVKQWQTQTSQFYGRV